MMMQEDGRSLQIDEWDAIEEFMKIVCVSAKSLDVGAFVCRVDEGDDDEES